VRTPRPYLSASGPFSVRYFGAARFAGAGAFAFGQVVAEFGAGFLSFGFEAFNDFDMLSGDVSGFADVVDEVVKFGSFELAILVRDGRAAVAAGFSGESAIGVRKLQLPMAIATDNGLELVDFVIEPIRFVGIFGFAWFAGDDRPDVEAVDAVFGKIGVDEFCNGGKEVDGHEHVL
jgi:hypothetical protein